MKGCRSIHLSGGWRITAVSLKEVFRGCRGGSLTKLNQHGPSRKRQVKLSVYEVKHGGKTVAFIGPADRIRTRSGVIAFDPALALEVVKQFHASPEEVILARIHEAHAARRSLKPQLRKAVAE